MLLEPLNSKLRNRSANRNFALSRCRVDFVTALGIRNAARALKSAGSCSG
jgi:hypothetical protein